VERLARIDVPDAGDGARVHQEVLHRFSPAAGHAEERFGRERSVERLEPEPAHPRVAIDAIAPHDAQEPERRASAKRISAVVSRRATCSARRGRAIVTHSP
jgi:hypothetical protein